MCRKALTLLSLFFHRLQGERRPKRRRKQLHDLSGVGSVGIVARGPLDEYRFNMFMRDLLAEKAKDIFRCKGVLAVHVSTTCMRAHSSRQQQQLAAATAAWRPAQRVAVICRLLKPGTPGTEATSVPEHSSCLLQHSS